MKTAIWGVWHVHAEGYTKTALENSEVLGVYDPDPRWRHDFAQKMGIPEFASPEELLASEAEGVIVCSATNGHKEDICRIARAGKHIFTEKVLALTSEDCAEIRRTVEETGVRFVISLPQKYFGCHLAVKEAVDSGKLGKINYLRFRNCHNGSTGNWLPPHFYDAEECGGGAMIDLGAHGMYLIDWFCGLPQTYASVFTTSCPNTLGGVEDNAVTVMGYGDGCIAVNETGFVSGASVPTLEIRGEQGNIWYSESERRFYFRPVGGTDEPLPERENAPSPLMQFLTGELLPGCGITEAEHLTAMMEGAYANAR